MIDVIDSNGDPTGEVLLRRVFVCTKFSLAHFARYFYPKRRLHYQYTLLFCMRPSSPIHRNERLVFRVYSLEKKAIQLAAQKIGLSVSDYARRVCLDQELKARLTDEEINIYKMLIEYRNNFSRIGKVVKHNQRFFSELQYLIHHIDKHLKRFSL